MKNDVMMAWLGLSTRIFRPDLDLGLARALAWASSRKSRLLASALLVPLVGLTCACGGRDHDHNHDLSHGHAESRSDDDHQGHAHHAPHGGALAMLGDHAFQLELIPQPSQGKVDLYILDGEAERYVRLPAPWIDALVRAGERQWSLRFLPVANQATGETLGDSAYFSAEAPEVADLPAFEISFENLELLGEVYESFAFPYPEGSH